MPAIENPPRIKDNDNAQKINAIPTNDRPSFQTPHKNNLPVAEDPTEPEDSGWEITSNNLIFVAACVLMILICFRNKGKKKRPLPDRFRKQIETYEFVDAEEDNLNLKY